MKKWFFLWGAVVASVVVFASCSSLPRRGQIAFKPIAFKLRDIQYPSGLRVLAEEDRSRPIVSMVTVVDVGSADDPAGGAGLAHLIEHLTFRAKPDNQATVAQVEQYLGAASNAQTTFDATTYVASAPSSMLQDLLRVESARLQAPLAGVNARIFDVEREVVRNELRERSETGVYGGVIAELQTLLFPKDHAYARALAGTHATLSSLTLEGAWRHAAQHYRPEKMTIVLSGDLNLEEVDQLVRSTLPKEMVDQPQGPAPVFKPRLPKEAPALPEVPPQQALRAIRAAVTLPEVWIGWTLPRSFGRDAFLNNLVTSALNGLLRYALATNEDIEDVATVIVEGAEATLLGCVVTIRQDDQKTAQAAIDAVLDEVFRVWRPEGEVHTLAQAIMVRLKMQGSVHLALGTEWRQARLIERANSLHFTGDPAIYGRTLQAINEVDNGKFFYFVHEHLTRARARALFVRPFEESAHAQLPPQKSVSVSEPPPLSLSRTPEEAVLSAIKPKINGYTTFTLENGLEVVLGHRPTFPVASAGILLRGGLASSEPAGAATLATAFARADSVEHGFLGFDFGGHSRQRVDGDALVWMGQVASGNVANLLAIAADRLTSMDIKRTEYLETRRRRFEFLGKAEDVPAVRANRAFRKALFGDHAYGSATPFPTWSKIDIDAARTWLEQIYSPDNAVLVVVGDIEVEATRDIVKERFGGWDRVSKSPTTTVGLRSPPPPAVLRNEALPRIRVTHQDGATQAQLELGCLLPSATAKDVARYDLLAKLLEVQLHGSLREDYGTSYGVHSQAQVVLGGTAFVRIQTAAENARLAKALELLRQAWDGLNNEIDLNTLDWARWLLMANYNVSFDNSLQITEAVLEAKKLGWPLNWADNYPEELGKVDAGNVQALFRSCHGSSALSIIGDSAVIEPALKATFRSAPR